MSEYHRRSMINFHGTSPQPRSVPYDALSTTHTLTAACRRRQDNFNVSVAGLTVGDYRLDGKDALICCSVDGEGAFDSDGRESVVWVIRRHKM